MVSMLAEKWQDVLQELTLYHQQGGFFRQESIADFEKSRLAALKGQALRNNCYATAIGWLTTGYSINPGTVGYLLKNDDRQVIGGLEQNGTVPDFDKIIAEQLQFDGLLQKQPKNKQRYFPVLCLTRSRILDYHFLVPHVAPDLAGDISFFYDCRTCYCGSLVSFKDSGEAIARYTAPDTDYETADVFYVPKDYLGCQIHLRPAQAGS